MDIYNKSTDSKRYVLFTSNHPMHCLTNIPFFLAKGISTIVKDENIKENRFLELKKIIAATTICRIFYGSRYIAI